ncbi:hypothetical protein ACLKMH_15755 [Psychromonas sp. KJ10-10]|uniref:hypothetical protein n=1 Tax=Psychromonas sp. KJ10-10 TaxID=3391823 RepID=UPI0039B3B6CA
MIKHKLNSTDEYLLNQLESNIRYAVSLGIKVCIGCEDASRADPEFLLKIGLIGFKAGAQRLRYADTLGILEPFTTFEQIKYLKENQPLPIEIHCHDDLGLATANTLARN